VKRLITFFLVLAVLPVIIYSQTDPAAVKVLDKFSSTATSAPSVSLKFRIITVNQAEGGSDTSAGLLVMMRDQYRLELEDNITWFNGTTSWNYLIAEKEVTITKPDKKDNSIMTNPSTVFTLYKKGYKTRLIEEIPSRYTIDLYPEATDNDMIRIRLVIGKPGYNLIGAEYKRKDGITVIIDVKDYNLKAKADPSAFTFNAKNYKGVDVIDMR
jgi:outer membrane lipoprotein-sorting protein